MMVSISCERENNPADLIKALEGRWLVDEQSEFYKSTSGTYYVDISISSEDSSKIFISNFYDLNYQNVTANVSSNMVELDPDQEISIYTYTYCIQSGSGIVSDDYQSIEWQYNVDDGSGQVDHVKAIYTKKQ